MDTTLNELGYLLLLLPVGLCHQIQFYIFLKPAKDLIKPIFPLFLALYTYLLHSSCPRLQIIILFPFITVGDCVGNGDNDTSRAVHNWLLNATAFSALNFHKISQLTLVQASISSRPICSLMLMMIRLVYNTKKDISRAAKCAVGNSWPPILFGVGF